MGMNQNTSPYRKIYDGNMFCFRCGPCPVENYRNGGYRMDMDSISGMGKGTDMVTGTYCHDHN